MYITYRLSRAPEDNSDIRIVEEVDNTNNLAVSPKRLIRIQNATEYDDTSKIPNEYKMTGWPRQKDIRSEHKEYYSIRKI